jgi:hypothetical protein
MSPVRLSVDDQLRTALAQHRPGDAPVSRHAEADNPLARFLITFRIVSKFQLVVRLIEQKERYATGRQRVAQALDDEWDKLVKVRPLRERIGEFMYDGRPVLVVHHAIPRASLFLSYFKKSQATVASANNRQLKLTSS